MLNAVYGFTIVLMACFLVACGDFFAQSSKSTLTQSSEEPNVSWYMTYDVSVSGVESLILKSTGMPFLCSDTKVTVGEQEGTVIQDGVSYSQAVAVAKQVLSSPTHILVNAQVNLSNSVEVCYAGQKPMPPYQKISFDRRVLAQVERVTLHKVTINGDDRTDNPVCAVGKVYRSSPVRRCR